jgi:hypothetical protein
MIQQLLSAAAFAGGEVQPPLYGIENGSRKSVSMASKLLARYITDVGGVME